LKTASLRGAWPVEVVREGVDGRRSIVRRPRWPVRALERHKHVLGVGRAIGTKGVVRCLD
jgi:hypothetical protein